MSKPELIRKLKKKNPELHISDLHDIIDIFCESIEKALIDKKKVELRGFGTFFTKKIEAKYSARNPKTGEIIYVPEKIRIRFKASKKFKELINKWKKKKYL